jgi:hypothetical protein
VCSADVVIAKTMRDSAPVTDNANQRAQERPWLNRVLGAYARLEHGMSRLDWALVNAAEGLLSHSLTSEEKSALTVHLYDVHAQHRVGRSALFGWEMAWFGVQLPAAPAHVLIGGAGDGLEADWLRERGYRVSAFEPASHCLDGLRAAVGPLGTAERGTYQELIDTVLGGSRNRLTELSIQRYDAVVLGWGSLSHVFGSAAQRALLQACAQLSPDGPILASFWLLPPDESVRHSRAAVVGAMLGAQVGRLRGLPQHRGNQRLTMRAGFLHVFSRDEIDRLASAIERNVQLESDWYPHAAFTRVSARR